jgi:hypothetical protein
MARRRNGRAINQRRRYRSRGKCWLGRYRRLPVDCAGRQVSQRRPILLELSLLLFRRGEREFLFDPLLIHQLNDAIDLPA